MTLAQRDLRRTAAGLVTDIGGFGMGLGFISPPTVLPVLVRQLTSSAPLVGLLSTVWAGAWLAFQLPAGRWLANKPRKKPFIISFTAIGRPALLLLAAMFAFVRPPNATLFLVGLFAGVILFRATDSFATVGWLDIVSKAVPAKRRGRVIGGGQVIAGLLALVAAAVVRWALEPSGPPFPNNFAMLFALAFGGMAISWIGLNLLVEPQEPVDDTAAPQMNAIAQARHVVGSDRAFRQVTLVRLLAGMGSMALPFYIVHATAELGLPVTFVGLAIAIQNISTIVSSLGWGALSERKGCVRVIQLSALVSAFAPVAAFALHALRGSDAALLSVGYLLVFAAISAVDNAVVLGYLAYVMEIAPPSQRSAYLGLTNTLGGIPILLPVVGGALLEATSYPLLFAVAATGTVGGLILATRLPRI